MDSKKELVMEIVADREKLLDKAKEIVMDNKSVVERDKRKIEITAEDFGLLDDENYVSPLSNYYDELYKDHYNFVSETIRRGLGVSQEQIFGEQDRISDDMAERVRQQLENFVAEGNIQNYQNFRVEGDTIYADIQPVFPISYINIPIGGQNE